jgi:hypothetical protein
VKNAWLLAAAAFVAAVVVPMAGAHSRTGLARGYVSTFVQLRPNVLGLTSGVWENTRSAAVYLNRDRYGRAPVLASADPSARPRWRHVAGGNSYGWHDHRIHWMSRVAPAAVRDAPDRPHRVFDWKVPGRAGGRQFMIEGFLGYVPPPGRSGGGTSWTLVVAVLDAAAGLAVTGFLLKRR